ncbi:MAG: EAL domain-containing protein [Terricaulis sp.]
MPGENSRTVHYKNDLRRLTLLIGGALAFFGVLLLVVVVFAGWSANRSAVTRERQLVENALDDSVSRVLDEQKSVAWWDDAVVNVASGPVVREWADVEFGAFLHETYGHTQILVLNANNQPVYAYVGGNPVSPTGAYAAHRRDFNLIVAEARGVPDSPLRVRARVFEANQSSYRELLGANAQWSGHLLMIDGRPAVASAITIVPNADPSLLHGAPYLLLSVVPIDTAFLEEVGAGLLLPDLTWGLTGRRGDGIADESFVADDGAPLGHFSWTTKQPGKPLLMFILPLVAVGMIGAGMITAGMIGRLKLASGELADREQAARHESMHDALSGLPNRRNFAERLQEQLDRLVQTRNNARVVVAYIDVDRFKDVNDTLGHHAGDALVKLVAERLSGLMGPNDLLSRFGGDEFAVMRAPARAQDAAELASMLRNAFERGFEVFGQEVMITASIGISAAPDHGATPEDLMRHADIALYQGKSQGRDRAMFFCAEMAAEVEQRRTIELDLRAALEREELTLHYQPVISCARNVVGGVEALLRWRHPEKGDISPAVFVPVAEEAGLMPALGAWVLSRAFADCARWPGIEVAVNLSPVQFRNVDLIAMLKRLLVQHNVDPSRIVLEVTEGVLLESTDRNRTILEAIREIGFKVALDDFGTGYSSLRYLSDFRFDKIKIDRAFVTGINERKRAMTIIQSVVALGRALGMSIVAEGVETEAEASVMRLLGVSELQGYYFSRPVEPERIAGIAEAFAAASAGADQPVLALAGSSAIRS